MHPFVSFWPATWRPLLACCECVQACAWCLLACACKHVCVCHTVHIIIKMPSPIQIPFCGTSARVACKPAIALQSNWIACKLVQNKL